MKLDKYFYLGIFFLVIQILVFIRNYLFDDQILFFYYCNHIALFLAIAFFMRNIPLIKAFISTGLIIQLIYLADLIAMLFFNTPLTGSTAYLLNYSLFPFIITLLTHFGTVFVALIFIFREKNKIISLIYGFLYLCFLYLTTILFTPKGYDVNCVYNACGASYMYFNGFTTYWIFIVFIILVIPTYYLQELLYYLSKKKS